MPTFASQVLHFLSQLHIDAKLPRGVALMNPYQESASWDVCQKFYKKYYNDSEKRRLILGINPGRFGGGITGIPFTDPIKLEKICGIPNELSRKAELSADFIYQMIAAYGGPESFYKKFYITAVSPLGFTSRGKNLNYYDVPELEKRLGPFIISCLTSALRFYVNADVAFCLGEGKNFKFLSGLNDRYHFFGKILPLAHPRFIMQYRRKKVDSYVADYISKLNQQQ